MNNSEVLREQFSSVESKERVLNSDDTREVGALAVNIALDRFPTGVDITFSEKKGGFGRYDVWRFTEGDYAVGAFVAQRIQGESYRTAGYVKESGLSEDGRLLPELDRSRGDNVTYYIAMSDKNDVLLPQASVRQISIAENNTIEDMIAFKYSKDALYEGEAEKLLETFRSQGRESVVEIAALSKTNKASSFASLELVRHMFTESIRAGKPIKWLATLASPAHMAMVSLFGDRAVRQIGDEIEVDIGDLRTSEELRLVPSIIEPQKCLSQIVESIDEAWTSGDEVRAKRFMSGFDFIKAGLRDDEINKLVDAEEVAKWKKIVSK